LGAVPRSVRERLQIGSIQLCHEVCFAPEQVTQRPSAAHDLEAFAGCPHEAAGTREVAVARYHDAGIPAIVRCAQHQIHRNSDGHALLDTPSAALLEGRPSDPRVRDIALDPGEQPVRWPA